jgi:TetR/AcrR family transcriptional regulator, cholesterol catabolism regulator
MDDQRELIIQTATRMFEQFGIRSVSVDSVCAELRISKKTFYVYFSQKEDLVEAVLSYQKSLNLVKYAKLLRDKNAIDSLILIIREIKNNVDCQPQTMWYDIQKYYPKLFEKYQSKNIEEMRQSFELNLKQGIAEGYYREDLDVELTSLFHSIQVRKSFELMNQSSMKFSKKRLINFFIDLMVHLIANENGLRYVHGQIGSLSPEEELK